jgi:dihydroneopterin aldolase
MNEDLDVIRINNMVFYGYHGVEESEKHQGQRFEVDVELFCDLRRAGKSDQISDTIDYTAVYQIVEELVMEGDYNLIEALAEDIAQKMLERFSVEGTVIRVRKPHVSLRGLSNGVEVEILRQ